MRDVLEPLIDAWESGDRIGLGTVIGTQKSAPRPPGAAMLVLGDGSVVGSVSGGCVEGDVYELAQRVVAEDAPELRRYGYSDDEAFAVGLTCGGIVDVFVEPVDRTTFPELGTIAEDVRAGRPVAVATVIEHPDASWVGRHLVLRTDEVLGGLGSQRADHAVADDARGLLAVGRSQVLEFGPDGERMDTGMKVFVNAFQPRPRMIVFGAIDYAAAVARQAELLGYRVTVCDARPVFATPERFPAADEVVVSWPHRYLRAEVEAGRVDQRTVICVLTHDPKFDVPVLDLALRLEGEQQPFYIGAMGSRRTHDERLERLREAGLGEKQLRRLHSPIGLDLRGRTPEETAVAVAAELVALRWGGSGRPLHETDTAIHAD
ncbi:XdhC family protein [Aeromicrobium piscarium]|uniref:XshC-Cox1 family protein n=1 Tax=Aeromicrobium piscarium TaxID=2590901 RepID=A0A554SNV2_9ACTN|nr:XdhC family protein [Aeromicrobium piscarium]TSD68042.1 XshC-Cox1 family protein [Aeromicrobium piscarium]